jgi:hypothetical protein
MRKRRFYVVILALTLSCFMLASQTAYALTIESTFDSDLEGWGVGGVAPPTIQHVTSGGNPGGYLWAMDATFESFITAPDKFLGDLTAFVGGTMTFDHLAISGPVDPPGMSGQVTILSSAGSTSATVVPPPLNLGEWKYGEVSLTHDAWGVSEALWKAILADVTEIQVVVDTSTASGGEASGMDNFRITSSSVPEPSTMRLFASALVGLVGVRRKSWRS